MLTLVTTPGILHVPGTFYTVSLLPKEQVPVSILSPREELQTRKLRCAEANWLVWGHTASWCQNQNRDLHLFGSTAWALATSLL